MTNDKREELAAVLRRRIQSSNPSLSHGQRSLWLLQQLAPESCAYNIAFTARIVSPINAMALRRAFQGLVDRHDSLRSTFPVENGEPTRRIQRSLEVPFEEVDASAWPAGRLHDQLLSEINQPFDLANGPVMRVRLFKKSSAESYLAATFHHIALDGWSLWIVLSELAELYRAAVCGISSGLSPVARDYGDYLRWHTGMLAGPDGARHKTYWKEQLGHDLPILNLPADKARPVVQRYRGDAHTFRIRAEVTTGLKHIARQARATTQMAVLALWRILLYRYTGQDDFTVGYLASGRSRPELESVVGYLANPLALRAAVRPEMTYRDLLQQTRDLLLDALDHQDYPFSLVVEDAGSVRDPSRSPVFQALFVFEKPQLLQDQHPWAFMLGEPGARMVLGDLILESLPFSAQREGQYDLTLVLTEADGELAAAIDYNTDLFERATIQRLADHLVTLATSALAEPDRSISTLTILTAREIARMRELNAAPTPIAPACFHQLVEARAAERPDDLAVVCEGHELTYGELNRRANGFARYLRELGVGADTLVGLCVERSHELPVAMLGILKAGGAFVPLDPAYPEDRLAFMIADSRVPVLITQQSLAHRLPGYAGRMLRIDDMTPAGGADDDHEPAPAGSPDDLAYVIYTSGSTGRPKGVLLEHRGLVNVALEQQKLFGVGPKVSVLQFASLSFDAAVFEIAMGLGSGATLHLAPAASILPGTPLLNTLRASNINVVTLPPSALLTMPVDDLPALTTLTVAGEACPAELVARWAKGRDFFNLYGPTESTIWATVARCVDAARAPSIGRPIANTQVYVLDSNLQQVPFGVAGELHLGGAGLARGYLNQPELTASKFIANPFDGEAGGRLYKTGDLVRLHENGELEFLGRIDQQVKIRGFRIELGEIEAVLNEHPDVNQAAAIIRDDGPDGKRIVAYVIPRSSSCSAGTLRTCIRSRLPEFMVPAAFVFMDRFPVSPAGKVDRRSFPPPDDSRPNDESYVTPDGGLEAPIAAIWKEVLRVDRVSANDNFFDLGGTSLLIARVHARLKEISPSELSMIDMFQFPTIRTLAARLGRQSADRSPEASALWTNALVAGQARLRDQAQRRSRRDGGGNLE